MASIGLSWKKYSTCSPLVSSNIVGFNQNSISIKAEYLFPFVMKGWWSGGFGYGLWIGILVASGFSVVPVPSSVWKNEFKLTGNGSSKVRLMLHKVA